MSKLDIAGRPWVAFEVKNKQHRRWFAEFQQTKTWGRCPYRFVIDDESNDLVTMIQTRLIEHYLNKEFGNTAL